MSLTPEDATNLLVRLVREVNHASYTRYGYEVYLPGLLRTHLQKQQQGQDLEESIQLMLPPLWEAAWNLCRRGILRPGLRLAGGQATDDGASGNGYSITSFGKQWLAESEKETFVPTEPERFAQMLANYKDKYGASFQERAQEAVRCYGAHAYLACCSMCGAAAESIMLATAIAKHGESRVLQQYNRSNGRRAVENMILGQRTPSLKEEYLGYATLLKYWRDSASHGSASNITDNEAYTSLALLLRFALFTSDRWSELTS